MPPKFAHQRLLIVTFFLSISGMLPMTAKAVEFVVVGPRAVGMGGAGVAVTTDSLATYWNPAGLALTQTVDIRLQASAQGIDREGIRDTLKDIDDIDRSDISASNQARLQALLNDLNDASLSALAAIGAYVKGHWGDHAFGLNISDVGTGGQFNKVPLTATVMGSSLDINGQLQINYLEARQIAGSYAYAFWDKKISLGVTGKIIKGVAYKRGIDVDDANDKFNISDELKNAKKSYEAGVDVGAMITPVPWLRAAIVGKDLNTPTFKTPGGGEYKLRPQARAGLALLPFDSTTITFDADLTKNKTLLPGIRSRILSLGVEQGIYKVVFLRGGVLKNVEDAKTRFTPTAGLGVKFAAFQFDVGAGYDFDERGALGALSLAMTF